MSSLFLFVLICFVALQAARATLSEKEAILAVMKCTRQDDDSIKAVCERKLENRDFEMFKMMFEGFMEYDYLEGIAKKAHQEFLLHLVNRCLKDKSISGLENPNRNPNQSYN